MAWWVWMLWGVAAVLGAGALWVGYRALFWDRARGRRRCPKCWYDMAGVGGLVCPECGRSAGSERRLLRTRRRWGRAVMAVVLGAMAWGAAEMPRAIRAGTWWAVVPRPVMLAALPAFDGWGEKLLQAQMGGSAPGVMFSGAMASSVPTNAWERTLLARACARELAGLTAGAGQTTTPKGLPRSFAARMTLQTLGDEGEAAIPVLIGMLQKGDAPHRVEAAGLLGQFGLGSERAQAELGRALDDPEVSVRMAAVQALTVVWRDPTGGSPAMLMPGVYASPLLSDAQRESGIRRVRERAARAERLIARALGDPERGPRVEASEALSLLGECAPLEEALLEPLERSVWDERLSTGTPGVKAVAGFKERSGPALVRFLLHPSPAVRRAAVGWIGQGGRAASGAEAEGAAMGVLRMLDAEESWDLRIAAMQALARLGPVAAGALGHVERVRKGDASAQLRVMAVIAIGRIAGPSADGVRMLAEALGDGEAKVRRQAAEELGAMGASAAGAAGKLRELMSGDSDRGVRDTAAAAVAEIEGAQKRGGVVGEHR